MVFLLYGVLAARGNLISGFLQTLGLDATTLQRQLDQLVLPGDCSHLPAPTRNYEHCLWLAEHIAWQQGVRSVREQDLLWALLMKTVESGGLCRAFELLKLDPERLRTELAGHHTSPIMPSSLSSFSINPRAWNPIGEAAG